MAIRAFKATFLVAIDDQEALDNEDRLPDDGPVTLHELQDYLNDALRVDWNNEENGNACGVQSVEVDINTLQELTPNEVHELYHRNDG